MKKRTVTLGFVFILLLSVLNGLSSINTVRADTITVPDDYPTIQEAINNATSGDQIFVRNGTYNENLFIDKAISLTGENNNSTIIQGRGNATILVRHDDVDIKGFNIQCSLKNLLYDYGIHLLSVKNCNIFDNRLENAYTGVWLFDASLNNICENNITKSWSEGVLLDSSNNNLVAENTIVNNNYYGLIIRNSNNNTIHHNNFIENRISNGFFASFSVDVNQFDIDNQGNYWSDNNGNDIDGDGIGDTPYVINSNNQDNYPLMDFFDIEKNSKNADPFPTTLVLVMIATILGVLGIFVYFKKRRS